MNQALKRSAVLLASLWVGTPVSAGLPGVRAAPIRAPAPVESASRAEDDGPGQGAGAGRCAEWAARVNRLERVMRLRNPGIRPDRADVAYGKASREVMDVFLPPEALRDGAPIIVMVHGGGWCVGDKASAGVVENKVGRWTPRGFVVVSLNYPMVADGLDARAQAVRVAQAIAHVQMNARSWGGDARKVILMGHSAGAHLVSLVHADAAMRKAAGIEGLLGTVSLDAGAIDVVRQMPRVYDGLRDRYREAFGEREEGWVAASPHHRLTEGAAPWLGVCSTLRKDDPCGQAEAFVARAKSLGIRGEVLPQRKSHAALNKELGEAGPYTTAVERFLASLDAEVARRLKR